VLLDVERATACSTRISRVSDSIRGSPSSYYSFPREDSIIRGTTDRIAGTRCAFYSKISQNVIRYPIHIALRRTAI
jgi:hypothetical protein